MLSPKCKIMNDVVFTTLQAFTKCLHPSYRNVVLAFDSVKLADIVTGLTAQGGNSPPQNCLILDVKFFNTKRHQFIGTVCYYDHTDTCKVAHAVLAYIHDLLQCDLRVCATVSSGTPEMMKIAKELGTESKVDGPILFDFDCQSDIVHIIDPSWLLRELHFIFASQDIFFVSDSKILRASYQDISMALNGNNVTSAFRSYHFQDPRMSTTAAAKVFSYTIGQMLKETKKASGGVFSDTSDFCTFFDNIFDSVNAAHEDDFVVKMLRQPVRENSVHENFWRDAILVLNSMEGCEDTRMSKACEDDLKEMSDSTEDNMIKHVSETTMVQLSYLNELSKRLRSNGEIPAKRKNGKKKRDVKEADKNLAVKENVSGKGKCKKNNKIEPKETPTIESTENCGTDWSKSVTPLEALPILKNVFGKKNEKLTTKVDDSFSFGLIDIQKSNKNEGQYKLTSTIISEKEPEAEVTECVVENPVKEKRRIDTMNYVRKLLLKRMCYPRFDIEKFMAGFPLSPEKEIIEDAVKSLKGIKVGKVLNFDDLTKLNHFGKWSKSLRGFLYLNHKLSTRHLPYFDTKVVNCDTIHDKKHLVQLTNGLRSSVRIVEHTNLEPLDYSLNDYAWTSFCNITFK